MKVRISTHDPDDYAKFIAIKSLPTYSFRGRVATFPDEYGGRIARTGPHPIFAGAEDYEPSPFLFDYQGDIPRLAIRKEKFAIFAAPGYGKSLMQLEYVRYVAKQIGIRDRILLLAPLMVVEQTISEAHRFYGADYPIRQLRANQLEDWLLGIGDGQIGITNFESLTDTMPQGRLKCLCVDESSILKSHYGKWGADILRLGEGLRWKLAMTGTPAPNDRVEFANHAVFLDACPNVNSFLAKYFVNKGQTDNRWEMKRHAVDRFYRDLSHWSIFLTNPATYGWKDNAGGFPPINVKIHDLDMTQEQIELAYDGTGFLPGMAPSGGITNRSKMSQIAKGNHKGRKIATNKPEFIRDLVLNHPGKSSIIWCLYDEEQKSIAKMFPDAANISGKTPYHERKKLIAEFQEGKRQQLISKPKVLGFGMNLQVARQHVFSGIQDSYEMFAQCVHRSNRIGSTEPLDVDIPVTAIERPMLETVLKKAARITEDTRTQEALFKDALFS